jgi:hypothetical protein
MKKIGIAILILTAIIVGSSPLVVPQIPLSLHETVSISTPSPSLRPQSFLPIVLSTELRGYFVSPTGSDTNPGTSLRPWKTIGKAAGMVQPGDTVYIREGIYIEAPQFRISGTETSPVKIMAFPGENPIIDGQFSIPGPGGALLGIRGDHVYVSGLEVRNSTYAGIFVNGNYDTVDNMYVHHDLGPGIVLWNAHYSTAENNRVWRNSLENEYGKRGGWSVGLFASHLSSYITLRSNVVWENWGEGIGSASADQVTIEQNLTHDNYATNIYISDSTNVVCQRNFVYMDPASYVYGYGSNTGIMLGDETYTPTSANITVINNIAFGNHGNFWWWQGSQGGGMHNVLIANNTFVNGSGNISEGRGGVIIGEGDHQNVRFENNLIQQDGALPPIATVNQPGLTYSHNLWSKTPYLAASGPGDVIGAPQLAHMGGNPFAPEWYRLSVGSPAINMAQSIPEVTVDYFGNQRGDAPDMGASEYAP